VLLENLKKLDFSYNKFEELPYEEVEEDQTETEISEGIPATVAEIDIGLCQQLQYLNLSNNSFARWPHSLDKLEQLTELTLSYNQLETLPEEIENLKSLKLFYLSHNKMKQLPTEFYELSSLEVGFLCSLLYICAHPLVTVFISFC
jgi:leucine-rich repeat protein SHOC2